MVGVNLDNVSMNGPWRDANHIRFVCVKDYSARILELRWYHGYSNRPFDKDDFLFKKEVNHYEKNCIRYKTNW